MFYIAHPVQHRNVHTVFLVHTMLNVTIILPQELFRTLIGRTKKMLLCSGIYYSNVSILLNMFRATHRPSSGAQKL